MSTPTYCPAGNVEHVDIVGPAALEFRAGNSLNAMDELSPFGDAGVKVV